MSSKNTNIQHEGIVKRVDANEVEVSFISVAACASCHAKGVCGASDIKEKEVIVPNSGMDLKVGEHVMLELKQSLGMKAVFLGYILPFLIVLGVLIVLTILKFSELKAGLYSLLALVPYYIALYYQKDRLSKTYSFQIKKTSLNS